LEVRDPEPASAAGGGLAHEDEGGESAAVHEHDSGEVDLDAVGTPRGQYAEQSAAQHVGVRQVDLAALRRASAF